MYSWVETSEYLSLLLDSHKYNTQKTEWDPMLWAFMMLSILLATAVTLLWIELRETKRDLKSIKKINYCLIRECDLYSRVYTLSKGKRSAGNKVDAIRSCRTRGRARRPRIIPFGL